MVALVAAALFSSVPALASETETTIDTVATDSVTDSHVGVVSHSETTTITITDAVTYTVPIGNVEGDTSSGLPSNLSGSLTTALYYLDDSGGYAPVTGENVSNTQQISVYLQIDESYKYQTDVNITATVDSSWLDGKTLFVGESIVGNTDNSLWLPTASHIDPADADQQVSYSYEAVPTIDTVVKGAGLSGVRDVAYTGRSYSAVVRETDITDLAKQGGETAVDQWMEEHLFSEGYAGWRTRQLEVAAWDGSQVSITDTVTYTDLTPGREYKLTGTLYDKSTGEALLVDGETVTAETTFTPETSDGSVDVPFEFDASTLTNDKIAVAYESLSLNGVEVAAHRHFGDDDQTFFIILPETETPDTPTEPDTDEGNTEGTTTSDDTNDANAANDTEADETSGDEVQDESQTASGALPQTGDSISYPMSSLAMIAALSLSAGTVLAFVRRFAARH